MLPPSTISEAFPAFPGTAPDQRITAIVPARNEEMSIESCVRSLAEQPEIAEILVVNDQSSDRTAEIVRGLTAQLHSLRLLEAPPVPAGWLGKNHAIWEAAKHASSRWLLFMDADAELCEGAAAWALRIANENGAALVSFSPEQLMGTWYEKALIPFVYYRLAKHFPYDQVNNPESKTAAANGQFLMIRADVYDAVGGHQSVASDVLEDVALAKRVKAARFRIWFGSGAGVVRARMYRSFDAMWQGWEKNLYLLVGGTPGTVYREMFAVLPWISLALLIVGFQVPIALVAAAGLLLASHAVYAGTLLRNQFRGIYILYYIPAVLLYAAVLWASYRAYAQGFVRWKGRPVAVKAAD
ncbi:MAG TPA: glycosyltransferase [Candidatus Acidoferrum sp.]|nr:glycosyltransferase [Candidatus Acidoferrum sp.]